MQACLFFISDSLLAQKPTVVSNATTTTTTSSDSVTSCRVAVLMTKCEQCDEGDSLTTNCHHWLFCDFSKPPTRFSDRSAVLMRKQMKSFSNCSVVSLFRTDRKVCRLQQNLREKVLFLGASPCIFHPEENGKLPPFRSLYLLDS